MPLPRLQVDAPLTITHDDVSHQLFLLLLLQITLAMASLIFYLAWWMFYVWRAQKSLKQKLYSEHKMGHMHINFMVRYGCIQGLCLPCLVDCGASTHL